jgi:hypothetical protein
MPKDSTPRSLAFLIAEAARERGTDQRGRHANAGTRIGGAADDLQRLALAHIHAAYAQLVGVRVLIGADDFADHDLGEFAGHRGDGIDLQARHGQLVRKRLGGTPIHATISR